MGKKGVGFMPRRSCGLQATPWGRVRQADSDECEGGASGAVEGELQALVGSLPIGGKMVDQGGLMLPRHEELKAA
jgi:hypothetical protein